MMHVKGDYDAVQDRILLSVWGGPTGKAVVWLTRRQWLAIALSCNRAQATVARQGDGPRAACQKAADSKPEVEVRTALADKTDDGYSSDGRADIRPSLVSKVRFQRIASGIRIVLTAEEEKTLFLPLKGENLSLFASLVERLATKARWDFPAAISRMKKATPAEKGFVN